jgi:hypothetical protein
MLKQLWIFSVSSSGSWSIQSFWSFTELQRTLITKHHLFICSKSKKYFSSPKCPDQPWTHHPGPYSVCTGASFPKSKSGRIWSFHSPICLHGMHRDSVFYFFHWCMVFQHVMMEMSKLIFKLWSINNCFYIMMKSPPPLLWVKYYFLFLILHTLILDINTSHYVMCCIWWHFLTEKLLQS